MINLTTRLVAYHKMSSENFYTKSQIDDKLKDYTPEIEEPIDGKIYGRGLKDDNIEWQEIN